MALDHNIADRAGIFHNPARNPMVVALKQMLAVKRPSKTMMNFLSLRPAKVENALKQMDDIILKTDANHMIDDESCCTLLHC